MDYKETIKERLKILPNQLRTFVLDEKWRSDAGEIGKQFNFSEEKYASFENEILFVLIGMEPRNDFTENVKRELEIDFNTAKWIAEDVEKNIFSKVAKELSAFEAEPKETGNQSKVGSSFEEIILNQAKAMRPAVSREQQVASSKVQDSSQGEGQKQIHDYREGNDPYRETTE